MESVNPFSRLHAHVGNRLRDRARAHSFFRFVGRRFLDDRLFESAGALSFTTVFALVSVCVQLPLAMGLALLLNGSGSRVRVSPPGSVCSTLPQ